MTKEEIRTVAHTLIDTYNASLKVSSCTNTDRLSKDYIDVRLKSVIDHCLMVLIGSLPAEQKIPYTDRRLTELAEMEAYLKGEEVEVKPTTPISLSLLKTLMDERIEIWESSSNPFLVLHYDEVEKEYLFKRKKNGM